MTRPSHLGPVDGYALDDGFDDKFFDSVVELRYPVQHPEPPQEEPAAKRQRAEQQLSSSSPAEPASRPQQCVRVAACSMLLARGSEKFKRALHPDWSGSAKVLVLDIEEGQVEVYRHLLHNLHMAGTLKPWLPEGTQELAALLGVASREMVPLTLLGCAKALANKAEGLTLGEATTALTAGLHSATDEEEGQAALAALQKAVLGRLVALLSPLEQFWGELVPPPQQGDPLVDPPVVTLPLTGPVVLPQEVLELVLSSDDLVADAEETVLATVLAWLEHNTAQLSEEERREHAAQLLGHVRWGLVRPCIAAAAWHHSALVRSFDPQRELLTFLLLSHHIPDQQKWWNKLKEEHPRSWWRQRSGGTAGQPCDVTFRLEPSSEPGRLVAFSKPLFKHGVTLTLQLVKGEADVAALTVRVQASFAHLGSTPRGTSAEEYAPGSLVPSTFPLVMKCRMELKRSDGGQGVRLLKVDPFAMRMVGLGPCQGAGHYCTSLTKLGNDGQGQPFTHESLIGPHSPFMHGNELVVHASISFL